MLIFLSQMVNRFTEEYLDMVIQVNLTVMLVLATLWVLFWQHFKKCECFSFLGISQTLPATSYIKLIEIWMIFTMIYPFAETLLVCLKDAHKSKAVLVKGMKFFIVYRKKINKLGMRKSFSS